MSKSNKSAKSTRPTRSTQITKIAKSKTTRASRSKKTRTGRGGSKTICLNMIVKNESHVIRETLDTIKDYIDYWIICDTGSTDNTKELIIEYFDTLGIPGEIIEEPWADHFGYNRTVALKACKTSKFKPDYVWVIDADDLIVGDVVLPKTMEADSYGLTYGEGFTYMRNQIYNNKLDWEYICVRHEIPICTSKDNADTVWIKGDYYVDSRRLGDRSKDPQKYLKDALAMERCIKTEPEHATRYKFYIGQSYLDYGDPTNAIKWYQARIDEGGWREEVYYSYFRIAIAKERRGDDWEDVEKAYLDAWKYLPSRAEPLYEIAKHHRTNLNDYEKAYKYAKLASTIPFPFDQTLFLYKEIYDWKIADELGIDAFYVGKYQESFDVTSNLLKSDKPPDYARERIEENRDYNVEQIKPKYIRYSKIAGIKPSNKKRIILTITTCKRFDLFERTVNSFVNCCSDLDLIDTWYCVDDNSSPEDREKMEIMYPFFEYVWKTPEQKGHPQSMNIIVDKVVNDDYEYVLHMEDDWQYFEPRSYITESLDILKKDQKYGQVLFNKNYSETNRSRCIGGGIPKYSNGVRYLIHEHYAEGSKEYNQFKAINRGKSDCCYWPHYSLRPSVLRGEIFKILGHYRLTKDHFEYEYAKLYRHKGYVSVFFDTISCHHIGKLTYERGGTNAYKLNGIEQFGNITFDQIIRETKEEFNTFDGQNNQSSRLWIKVPTLDTLNHDLLYIPNIKNPNEVFDCNDDAICYNSLGYVKNAVEPIEKWTPVRNFPNICLMIDKVRYRKYLISVDFDYNDEMIKLHERGFSVFDWLIDITFGPVNTAGLTNFRPIENGQTLQDIVRISKEKEYKTVLIIKDTSINPHSLVKDLILCEEESCDMLVWNDTDEVTEGVFFSSGYDKILNENYSSLNIKCTKYIFRKPKLDKVKYLCLNLERRLDRKDQMIDRFANTDISDYQFYPAVDGSKIVPDPKLLSIMGYNNFKFRRGITGISLSYINMWKELIDDSDYDCYLILEDDVEFVNGFNTKVGNLKEKLRDKDWDVVMLGISLDRKHKIENQAKYQNDNGDIEIIDIDYNVCVGGTFAYLINKPGANKMLEWIDKNGLKFPIDEIMKKCCETGIVKMYSILPHLVFSEWFYHYTLDTDTDIQKDHSCIFDCPTDTEELPIAVTITTCKRRPLFDRMMYSLWEHCKDLNRVQIWYCIDDGSTGQDITMMNWNWPFLNILFKSNSCKGHASSIDMLPKLVSDCSYVLHLEDDWLFTQDFYLEDLINIMEREGVDQVLCVKRWGTQKQLESYSGIIEYNNIVNYEYNHYHPSKPERNKKFDEVIATVEHSNNGEAGWWWPGFSLNPGIWRTRLFSFFPLNKTNDFEYELSLRMEENNIKVITIDLCHHIGTEKSAYILNNLPRDYEKKTAIQQYNKS